MKYLIANWKMNMDSHSIGTWFDTFNRADASLFENKSIILAPSFPYLEEVRNFIKTPNTFVASQDVDLNDKGAHTGATGIFQVKEFAQFAIVGHSEKNESLETALRKRDLCLQNGITPITCFVNPQDIKTVYKPGSLAAWEDPQNISVNGVYRAKDPAEINKTIEQLSLHIEDTASLVYGGSVSKNNIQDLKRISNINGVLIGNASLDPEHFLYIIENA